MCPDARQICPDACRHPCLDIRSSDGDALAPGGPRPRALLALLLLDAGRVVGTDRLTDGLYGDEPPAGAANALQSQVSRLRKRLGVTVESLPAGYRLVADPEDVDAHRFERLARAGHRALAEGDHARAAELLREALGLWRGRALADLAGVPFAEAQAARLDELRLAGPALASSSPGTAPVSPSSRRPPPCAPAASPSTSAAMSTARSSRSSASGTRSTVGRPAWVCRASSTSTDARASICPPPC
ncbi:AfsR/SARP family transcriptional regulator [Streptomyces sp. NPDC055287]